MRHEPTLLQQARKENNPLLVLRLELRPTQEEKRRRKGRDHHFQGLFQRELADRLECSTICIRECERHKRLPFLNAILQNYERERRKADLLADTRSRQAAGR